MAKPGARFSYRAGGGVASQFSWWKGTNGQTQSSTYDVLSADEAGKPTHQRGPQTDSFVSAQTGETMTVPVQTFSRYGLDGYRFWHQVAGEATQTARVLRDGGQTVARVNGAGAVVSWNLSGGIGRFEGTSRRYYVRDHLGSVRAVVDAGGAVVEARDYYAWGLEMPGRVWVQGAPTREGYTGHDLDRETGMNYAWARSYMAALGRWTSTDPMNQYPSPYVYSGNNPISFVDQDGMFSTDVFRNRDGSYTVVNAHDDDDTGVYIVNRNGAREDPSSPIAHTLTPIDFMTPDSETDELTFNRRSSVMFRMDNL